jgi:hypothetical protein
MPSLQSLLIEAIREFLDSLDEIKYNSNNSTSACFFEFNGSPKINEPDYDVRITIPSFDSLGFGVIKLDIVFPVRIDKDKQSTMIEFASRLNENTPVGYFHFSMSSSEFMYKSSLQFFNPASLPSHERLNCFLKFGYDMASMYTERFLDVLLGGVAPETSADLSQNKS